MHYFKVYKEDLLPKEDAVSTEEEKKYWIQYDADNHVERSSDDNVVMSDKEKRYWRRYGDRYAKKRN